MISRVVLALLAMGGLLLAFVVKEAAKEAVSNEYPRWAPALARSLVRVAGLVHPRRREEWMNDVVYLQSRDTTVPTTGLWEAVQHLSAAPHFSRATWGVAWADS
ncbi:MAG: hypothetical protein LC808_36510 [Actinobacteria bacterium]|nr:hypothetical protein [Actinomycetota bacterium]